MRLVARIGGALLLTLLLLVNAVPTPTRADNPMFGPCTYPAAASIFCDNTMLLKAMFNTFTTGVAITGSISATTSAVATAAAPTYIEGSTNALSMDLSGRIRTLATVTVAPASAAATTTAATVGTSSALALAGATRTYLMIKNESASAFISCKLAGTAALNTAGSITIAPYASISWEGSYVPSDAVNCIASASSTPATLVSN